MRQQVVICPFWAAKWSGVMPRLFVGFLWLTLSIMSRHISEWPLCAAQWSGVLPWSLEGFLSSTHSMMRRQIPTWPNCAAAWNGVPPMNKIHFQMFVAKHFVDHWSNREKAPDFFADVDAKTIQLPLQKYHFKKWILPLKSFGFFVTALSTISLQISNWPFRAASVNRDCETLLQRGVSLSMKSFQIEHTVRHLINSFLFSLLKISTAMWGMNSSFTTNGNTSIFEVSFDFMLSSESVLLILHYAIPVCKTMQKK